MCYGKCLSGVAMGVLDYSALRLLLVALVTGALVVSVESASAQSSLDSLESDVDLTDFSLEDLMDIEVTSVSKRAQSLRETAAAAFVITQEDIRRSGVRTIPEALRLAPGVEVARIRSNEWAVSIRGFNGRFANKLLVLIDGRSIYTPFWAGVQWDVQGTLVEDIERIEVIRGPGASIWGANAVNGVINIITKTAKKTQGALVVAEGNTDGGWRAAARWGHAVRDDLAYRAFVQHQKFGHTRVPSMDISGADGWDRSQAGLRLDWEPNVDDTINFSAQIYEGDFAGRQMLPTETSPIAVSTIDDGHFKGGSVQGQWDRILNVNTDISVAASYEYSKRTEAGVPSTQDSFDFSADLVRKTENGISLQAGFGYHYDRTVVQPVQVTLAGARLLPELKRGDDRFNAFAQVEVPLFEDRVFLTAGVKIEDNELSGFEVQPTVRALWTPTENHALWAAYSRAVRTPARLDFDATNQPGLVAPGDPQNPTPGFAALRLAGAPTPQSLEAENLNAYEVGYRTEFGNGMSIDIAGYFNEYSDLIAQELGPVQVEFDGGFPLFVFPLFNTNSAVAETYGAEVYLDWPVTDRWKMALTYNYIHSELTVDDPINGFDIFDRANLSPEHQVALRTHFDVTDDVQFDVSARYVDELARGVSDYVDLDVRLGWQFAEGLGIELVGQGLLDKQRIQFDEPFKASPVSAYERRLTMRLTGRF